MPIDSAEITITSVPAQSTLAVGTLRSLRGEPIRTFMPDVPGDYKISAQSFSENTIVPTFDGAPDISSIATVTTLATIKVGTELVFPIVTTFGDLTLSVVVDSLNVLSASLTDSTTTKAYLSSQDATVLAKLAALVGLPVATLGPALPAKIGLMGIAIDAHFRNATAHPTGGGFTVDNVNKYVKSSPFDLSEAIQKLNEIRKVFIRHLLDSTSSTAPWHNSSDDTRNVPIVQQAVTVSEAVVLYADLFRSYEAHRVQTTTPQVHAATDTTNTLGSIDALSDLVKAVLVFMASATPTVPVNQSQSLVEAGSRYGFKLKVT